MKLWQGWHNTDLGRSYFHYGPLGGTKKQMGILAQTCKKRGVKMHGEKSGKWKKKNGAKKMVQAEHCKSHGMEFEIWESRCQF